MPDTIGATIAAYSAAFVSACSGFAVFYKLYVQKSTGASSATNQFVQQVVDRVTKLENERDDLVRNYDSQIRDLNKRMDDLTSEVRNWRNRAETAEAEVLRLKGA